MGATRATTPATGLAVDIDRLKADILELAEIGRDPEDRGIYRMGFTEADMEGRRWLLRRLEEAGLTGWMDGIANVHGRVGEAEGPAVIVGSHTDTVPRAGMLDGALGVLCGLECLRVLRERGVTLRNPVELLSFADEEGRFGGMIGSEAFSGLLTPESLHFIALDGTVLHEEMERRGLDPLGALEARRRPETVDSYIELHIEQGPVLDRTGGAVGVVDHITGLFKWLVRFRGEANHAGTTPMDMRRDAFMGLADFAHEIPRVLDEYGSDRSRATIGKAGILPGAPNTVPGEVEFSLDVRDTAIEVLAELGDAFRRTLNAIGRRRNLMLDIEVQSEISPVSCDPALVTLLEGAAADLGLSARRMPSGAAHDAQIVSHVAPVAMLFVPSREGQSHAPSEWTDWDDVEDGANLLLHALARRAGAP